MNRISTEIGIQLYSFNENLSVYKANRSSWVATICINPNKKSTGEATMLTLPDTPPQGLIPVERRIKIVTAVRVKLICERPKESFSHLHVRKVRQHNRHR